MTPLLEIENLAIRAGSRTLVRELSLAVRGGEMWAVLGRNGCGKTLFLRTAAHLRAPADGSVRYGGQPLAGRAPLEAARLRAFLAQSIHDAFGATVLEVVMLARHPYLSRWSWEGKAEHDAALAALRAMEVDDLAARDVMTLSSGERQRVAIAAILAQDAPLALLDEPVTHLDLHYQVSVLERLRERSESGRAFMLSLHDVNLAARFCTHAMLYRGDGTVTTGPVAHVLDEATLAGAFRHPLRRVDVAGQTIFVPG